jgi:hypothetical protein
VAIHWSTPAWLWPLLLVMAAGAVVWTVRAYGQTLPQVSRQLRRTLLLLRSAALLLLVLAIAGPVLSRLQTRAQPAELALILEDSGSMQIRDAAGDTASGRWTQALAVAAQLDSILSAQDLPIVPVVLRGNGLEPITEFRLDDPVVPLPVNHGTSLGDLQRQAADRLAGRPVRATVLLSDGQETAAWGANPRSARGARGQAGPVYVVGVGDENGPPDRVLKDLRYPDTAYEGDEVVVEFAVDHRYLGETVGVLERPITARLRGPQGVVAEQTVRSAAKLVPFEMSFRPETVGLQAFELEVATLDNERFPANNKASLAINVRQERARILLLSATPSWDVRFLAQAAAHEQRIALAVVQPGERGLVFSDSLTPWVVPTRVADWLRWDAVILTGWTGPLAALTWSELGQAVEQGLGLLVMPGSSSGPGGGPLLFAPPDSLAALLPVQIATWRWLPGPFFAEVPPDVGGHPILGGVEQRSGPVAGAAGAVGLGSLPPVALLADVTAARAAEVLLTGEVRGGERSGGARLMLAVTNRGRGRVAWFGARHLWELAFWESSRGAEETHAAGHAGRRLTRNLLVWAAAGLEESGLVFSGRQTFFQEGEPIRLTAQWRDMRGRPVTDRQLNLVLRGGPAADDSAREQTYALRMSAARPGLAEVALPPLAPGQYSVQLQGAGDPPVLGREENLIVADHSIEMTQVRMDRRRLVQLAEGSRGRFYDAGLAADMRRLVDDLLAVDWRADDVTQRHRLDIRAGWPLLIVVAVLLGIEWYLRRRHGLL